MRLIQERIEAAAEGASGVVAFDADGTLWSGDVGEDAFVGATRADALREDALPALQRLAVDFDIPVEREANAQARVLFQAYRLGRLPEVEACGMMAWAFAGWQQHELSTFLLRLYDHVGLEQRRFDKITQLIHWSREKGFRTVIISASPDFAVAAATSSLGFEAPDVAACAVQVNDGVLQSALQRPVPYGEHKVHALQQVAPGLALVAAFGDNSFDLPLLRAARVGVAVRPKPALVALLAAAPELLILGDECSGT